MRHPETRNEKRVPRTATQNPVKTPHKLAGADDNLSSSQAAYHAIKRDIIRCELGPGTEVTEARLSDRYAFGKSPIRWALASLRKDGFVVALPRRGYLISPVTIQDINSLFDLRLILEPRAGRIAVGRINTDILGALREYAVSVYEAGDREGEDAFLDANRRFHMVIAAASGNKKLARILNQIFEEMERLYHLGIALNGTMSQLENHHQDLIDAFCAGDPDVVEKLISRQIDEARHHVLNAVLNSGSLQQHQITIQNS